MIEIVICAENPITRAGLAAMAQTAATEVVAQVGQLQALSHWLQSRSADLAVIELSALYVTNLSEVAQMIEALPDQEILPVLLLVDDWQDSTAADRKLVLQVLGMGAVSMLPISISAYQMRDAIAAITSGLTVLHPEITETLLASSSAFASTEVSFPAIEPLTPREVQVLNQLADGLTNKAIAGALSISEHTVKFHISAILSKLSATSRTEAVAIGIRFGLVML